MPIRSLQVRLPHTPAAQYAVALAAMVAALGIRWSMNPLLGDRVPYMIVLAALLLLVIVVRLGPFIAAATFGWLGTWYLFVEPRLSFNIARPIDSVQLAFFAGAVALAGVMKWRLDRMHSLESLDRRPECLAKESPHTPGSEVQQADARARQEMRQRERAEAALASDRKVLELIASGASLQQVLDVLMHETEAQSPDDMLCSILLLDQTEQKLVHGSAPSLPEGYCRAIDGIPVGPDVGSCGTAAFRREAVFVTDIAGSPLWQAFLPLAKQHGLGACCSTPIFGSCGQLLGTIAMYYRHPHEPGAQDRQLIQRATHLAGIAIERKRAEEAQARLAAIVQDSDDAIVSKTLQGIILSWNAGAQRLFGYTSAEAVGKPIDLIVPPELRGEEQSILARLRRGERVDHFQTIRVAKGGRRINISLTVSPVRDRSGRIVGASKVARDITPQKEAEQRVHSLVQQLRDADRRKDEFLATLAHELRNPLAPIRNALEIIKHADRDRAMLAEARDTMDRQLRQLVRLVDDLLDVSRITQDKLELRKSHVELAAVVQQAVEICRSLADCSHHQIELRLPKEPVELDADPVRLAQVFSNLLNNACKYTEPGGLIQILAERQGSDAVVTIRDNGIGIPIDKLERIFDMFTQVEETIERSRGGLGIGLTLVKRLVEMHGGSVLAHSDGPGRGSQFTVRLPQLVRPAKPAPAVKVPESAASAPRCILVVDDNRDSAESLARLLRLNGHVVHTAFDGLDAVHLAEQVRPNLVLLDIGLPGLNGYDAARRIREQLPEPELMLVALSGWGQEEDRRRSREAGFDLHLVKPVDFSALEKLVSTAPVSVGEPSPAVTPAESATCSRPATAQSSSAQD